MHTIIRDTLTDAQAYLENFLSDENNIQAIADAAEVLIGALSQDKAIYSCGNGGSATAISDPGHISCVANDFGYEHIFSRYLQGRARAGDCLLAISTSGTSKNVIRAAEYARESGIAVVSLTGKPGSVLGKLATVDISTGTSRYADRVQEVHIKVIHILIELIERRFFPENYQSAQG